jgi:antitoxin component YwqK of YwqJK toxin-antitoxin module|tara:strand:+ start:242 stop:1342 length:1101 start_codon:yes stop_codon:yes gene_type:complete
MEKTLSILLISVMLIGCNSKSLKDTKTFTEIGFERHYQSNEVTSPNDSLTYLKHDMSLLNGMVNGREFIDGKKHGVHNFYKHEYDKYGIRVIGILKERESYGMENYINGKRDGLCVYFYRNGRKSREVYYKNDRRTGIIKDWYDNGQLNYHRDEPTDFIFEDYYYDGQVRQECFYDEDKNIYIMKCYYKSGKLKKEANFVLNYQTIKPRNVMQGDGNEGYLISPYIVNGTIKAYHSNGKIGEEEKIFKCNSTGPYRTWHNNGQLRYKVNMIKNLEQGPSKWYYRNGQIGQDFNYVNGKLEGLCIWYNKSGKLMKSGNFIKGKLNGTKFYFNFMEEHNEPGLTNHNHYSEATAGHFYGKGFWDPSIR